MRSQRGKFQKKVSLEIELASTMEVDKLESIASDFFERIFEMDRDDCLITDESSLWDFHGEISNEPFYSKILEVYGIDVSDLEKGNLAQIFQGIMDARGSLEEIISKC